MKYLPIFILGAFIVVATATPLSKKGICYLVSKSKGEVITLSEKINKIPKKER